MSQLCPRCGIGIDDDGDGDCAKCAGLKQVKATFTKVFWVRKDQDLAGIGRMYRTCYGMTVEEIEEVK
jgi:hypothetical protein